MSGYWIVRGENVKDDEALKAYNDIFAVIAKRYRVEIIAGRDRVETVEGTHYPRQFILRFDSFETAKACYVDPGYQASLELAKRAYSRELSILKGADSVPIAISGQEAAR
ncbi:hypothetical protein ASD00_31195 [Ensifer sp. Root31]|uniref:DUF1330 domain-containing protein n=1 Tax=Ensifer sp. Root31 TaxID=1736512 RepID=UPI00070F8323|nr:DUF1330 domain-containing protein [Ensifer sp. Root31]KQU86361.1 hypothetical protein ASD00_31195 [Ensifer sp. Root31]